MSDEPSDVGGVGGVGGVAAVTTQLSQKEHKEETNCDLSSSVVDEEEVEQVEEPLTVFSHDEDVVVAEEVNSSMSACGEERSIIRTSNKPAHLKR